MLTPLWGMPETVIGFEASGRVSNADYKERLIPALEKAIAEQGPIRFLFVLGKEFEGYEPTAMWDDTFFGLKHIKDFKKIILMVAGAAAKMQMDGQLNLKHEQEILINVADMLTDLLQAESTLLRVQKLVDREKKHSQEVYDALVKTFIADANARQTALATGDIDGTPRGMSPYSGAEPAQVDDLACNGDVQLID